MLYNIITACKQITENYYNMFTTQTIFIFLLSFYYNFHIIVRKQDFWYYGFI